MFKYKVTGVSDTGAVKKENQDSLLIRKGSLDGEPFIFALVADGMGGVMEGELASRTITAAFADWVKKSLKNLYVKKEPLEELLAESWEKIIEETTSDINAYSKVMGYGTGEGPGTTLCALLLFNGTYYVANIGDSRAYILRGDEIKQITTDHSWEEEAKEQGYSPMEIVEDPRRNSLTRCIGAGLEHIGADYFAGEFTEGNNFILCTDGFRRLALPGRIESVFNSKSLKDGCNRAINELKENGETDNITVIAIATKEDKPTERLSTGKQF